jgi:hypothetical protein
MFSNPTQDNNNKILITPLEELKQRILERYDIEDIIVLLGLDDEDILDAFEERMLKYLDDFCVTTDMDFYSDEENLQY